MYLAYVNLLMDEHRQELDDEESVLVEIDFLPHHL
jgi:hypothetical protein